MANASMRSLAQIGREFSNFRDCQCETGRNYSAQRLSAPMLNRDLLHVEFAGHRNRT